MARKKKKTVSLFAVPESLSEKDLLIAALHEISRLRADVLLLTRVVGQTIPDAAAQFANGQTAADREAFAELERLLAQFATRKQKGESN